MVFSSVAFLGLFFPIVFFSYYVIPKRWKNCLLAFASIVFYAWGEPRFVLLMLASIAINFRFAIAIDKGVHQKFLLGTAIPLNLLMLGIFKYSNFIVDNLNLALTPLGFSPWVLGQIALPIGISFYTFHAISYLIDIYRGNAKPNSSIVQYSLYIMFFPQLVAGPIIRYKDIHTQLSSRVVTLNDINEGIVRFAIGLAKKVLIANQLGLIADTGFNVPANGLGPLVAWLCLLCYTLQIYFDFSGYSDMAIGLARMFGFRFPENFNYPYSARSVQDFWRRWHISLSTWFRDYVYIPLGGNRLGEIRTLLNQWTVFLLTGLWHGASWNFVIWGAIHGFFLMIERIGKSSGLARFVLLKPVQHLYTILVVMLAWVFFRATSIEQSKDYLLALIGWWPKTQWTVTMESLYSNQIGLLIVLAVVLSLGLYRQILRVTEPAWSQLERCAADGWLRMAFVTPMLIVSFMSIALGQYNPFIYFRF